MVIITFRIKLLLSGKIGKYALTQCSVVGTPIVRKSTLNTSMFLILRLDKNITKGPHQKKKDYCVLMSAKKSWMECKWNQVNASTLLVWVNLDLSSEEFDHKNKDISAP